MIPQSRPTKMATSANQVFNKKTWIHAALIAAMAFAAYSNSLGNSFLMDDHVDLFSPQGVAYKSLGTILLAPQLDIYRPFAHFALWLAYQLFGADAFLFHAANLGLFALIGALLYLIVLLLANQRPLALLTGILFAWHPINGMLVNYASALQIGIYVAVTQLSFLMMMISLNKREHRGYYYLSLGLYALCLMSHEMSYIFPVIIAALMYFIHRLPASRALLNSLPFFAMALAYFAFRALFIEIHAANEGPGFIVAHLGLYFSSFAELIRWYLSKLLFPTDILLLWSSQMDYQLMNFEDKVYLGFEIGAHKGILFDYLQLMIMAAAPAYFIFAKWKRGWRPFLLFVFALGLSTAGYAGYLYFPMVRPFIEPHWFYFTSMGYFVCLASILIQLKNKWPNVLWGALIAVILCGYFFSTKAHNEKWADQETYGKYWLLQNKGNMTPYYWLGKTLMERGEFRTAVSVFEQGEDAAFGMDARIAADLGWAHYQSGNVQEALRRWVYADRMGGLHYAPLNYYYGEYFLAQDDFAKANMAFGNAALLDPRNIAYQERLKLSEKLLIQVGK